MAPVAPLHHTLTHSASRAFKKHWLSTGHCSRLRPGRPVLLELALWHGRDGGGVAANINTLLSKSHMT